MFAYDGNSMYITYNNHRCIFQCASLPETHSCYGPCHCPKIAVLFFCRSLTSRVVPLADVNIVLTPVQGPLQWVAIWLAALRIYQDLSLSQNSLKEIILKLSKYCLPTFFIKFFRNLITGMMQKEHDKSSDWFLRSLFRFDIFTKFDNSKIQTTGILLLVVLKLHMVCLF